MENKVALVTGASSGIGRASARIFAREGAKVAVVDIKSGEETVRMIKEAGGEAMFIEADVTKAAEVEAMVDKIVETYGRLDCAHNNAGLPSPQKLLHECTEAEWDSVLNVNLKGVWLCMKYEIPQMLKQGKGAIVNTVSALGLVSMPKRSEYTASKHGVAGLIKAAALDYASTGIRINGLAPALTLGTPLIDSMFAANPELEAQVSAMVPMGRGAQPEEIAVNVVWLCSDAASFVTGHVMVADGGWTAQ